MAFDFKKEYREFYMPPKKPAIVDVPAMQYVAVRGAGNPNSENGAYQQALRMLYGIAFTIKMSYKGEHQIEGYFQYVVPPLEGLWWQDGAGGIDYGHKEAFQWISMIRLPDFVTRADFDWAVAEATAKKKAEDVYKRQCISRQSWRTSFSPRWSNTSTASARWSSV